jgi:DNA-binding CsgD family transcriptional regulator
VSRYACWGSLAYGLDTAPVPVDNGGVPAAPDAGAQSVSDLMARVEAERAGHPFLVFSDGGGTPQVFHLEPETESVAVGRLPSCELVLSWDDQVSRLHGRFERVGDEWEIVDQSRNGTFVNDQRLTSRYRLRDGDTVRFGITNVVFRTPAQRAPTAPAATAIGAAPQPQVALSSTQRRVLQALCRPYKGRTGFATPATDEQIAEELFLSIAEVRTHLSVLYAKLGVEKLPDNERRGKLVEAALFGGLISERDL